jgi:Ca2+-binding RTX toxin-like protein
MAGGGGADTLKGGSGNDVLIGGAGGDQLDGGSGVDTLDYRDSGAGVTIDLKFFKSGFGGDAAGDLISGFENVNGSANTDGLSGDDKANVLSGDAGSDRLFGAGGNDTLAGGLGADALGGSAGADEFKYVATAESGITAATRDVLFDFSHAQGDDRAEHDPRQWGRVADRALRPSQPGGRRLHPVSAQHGKEVSGNS